MQRYGMVLGVKPEKLEEYKRLHAAVWPEILRLLEAAQRRVERVVVQPDARGVLYPFAQLIAVRRAAGEVPEDQDLDV